MATNDNQQTEPAIEDEIKVEVIQSLDTLGTLVKAEIDMQIATAKAYPRSLTLFLKKVESIATISPSVAESCSYALVRKKKNKKTNRMETVTITGPSVRFAEIVVSSYGNIRAGARAISNDGRFVTCQGICWDLESNTGISVEVKRRITTAEGKMFSEDLQVLATNAGCAIAFRNAVFKIVPTAICSEPYEKTIEVAKGTAETLPARRDKAVLFFRGYKVTDEQICDALDIKEINDIDLDKLQILSGMKASLVNQEQTIDELFPPKDDKDNGKSKKATDDALNMLKTKKQN